MTDDGFDDFIERRKADRRAENRRSDDDRRKDWREEGQERRSGNRRRKDRRVRCVRCGRKYVISAEGPACQCRMDALRTPGNHL